MLPCSPFPERRGNTALQSQYSKAEKEICKSQHFLLFCGQVCRFIIFRRVCGFIVFRQFWGFIVFESSLADLFFVCSFADLFFCAFVRIYCFCTHSCWFILSAGPRILYKLAGLAALTVNANFATVPGSVPASSDTVESDSDRWSRFEKKDRKKCR